MSIQSEMIKAVVRITSAGDLLGSGFLLAVPSETEPKRRWWYLVTAHHVIRNQPTVEIEIPNPFEAHGALYPPVPVDGWRKPLDEVDIAVAPYHKHKTASALPLDLEGMMIPKGGFPHLGSTFHYLGIFAPMNLPMVRTGTIGNLYVPIDKTTEDGQQRYRYSAHLVDTRSYSGFSGSPCLSEIVFSAIDRTVEPPLYNDTMAREDGSERKLAEMVYLVGICGMFTAHYDESRHGGPVSHMGTGIMLTQEYIREAVMTDEAKAERREWDEAWDASQAAEQPPLVDTGVEFERFEDLTRRLVQAPKPPSE